MIALSGTVGAIVGGGFGAGVAERDERDRGVVIGAIAGALVGHALGRVLTAEDVPPPRPVPSIPIEPIPEEEPGREPVVEARIEPTVKPVERSIDPSAISPRLTVDQLLNRVHFDFDRSEIKPEFEPILDDAAQILRKHPDLRVRITGHADAIGTLEYNKRLSERRANAVKRYLMARGIPAHRLETLGMGELEPIAPNTTMEGKDDPAGRALNRRAQFDDLSQD
jgi:outer membrane protein OmpA-like peptidoglycan-associated protein